MLDECSALEAGSKPERSIYFLSVQKVNQMFSKNAKISCLILPVFSILIGEKDFLKTNLLSKNKKSLIFY